MKHKAEFILSIINASLSALGFIVLIFTSVLYNNPQIKAQVDANTAQGVQNAIIISSLFILIICILSFISIFIYRKGKNVTAISIISIVVGAITIILTQFLSIILSAMLIVTGILGLVRRKKVPVTFEQ
ncbi:hypothetical protein A374_07056 [Fictibacillus macauensis ZFHKF-1]|uniref:DUF4064 domain-containing protein n=1 Tax=Fictibacillus macauensis ZFHKF-1 TaxID=1196324 RepID=I8AKH3_9BACL|nr:DUF4064 domain-containing protein [Fictibacillus macauensis]EIT86059.1 hypothetical protein A374_07056 [Fictibacillus macauensis ZFHKF-1]